MFWDLSEIIDFIGICNEINDFTVSQNHTTINYVTVFIMVLEGLKTCRSQGVVHSSKNEIYVHQA